MPATRQPWFAVSTPGSTKLTSACCGREIDLGFPSLDHHCSTCPACGADSVFVTWGEVLVQVVVGAAPPELARTLKWAQDNLDELEFVTLLSSLAEVHDAILEELTQKAQAG